MLDSVFDWSIARFVVTGIVLACIVLVVGSFVKWMWFGSRFRRRRIVDSIVTDDSIVAEPIVMRRTTRDDRVLVKSQSPPKPESVDCDYVKTFEFYVDDATGKEPPSQPYHKFLKKHHTSNKRIALGVIICVAAWPIAMGLLALYVAVSRSFWGVDAEQAFQSKGTMGGLFMCAFGIAMALWRLGKRFLNATAYEELQGDRRAPVLLLRAFVDDFHSLPGYSAKSIAGVGEYEKTFEEFLCKKFRVAGPTIAIGRPGERIPPLGAARAYIPDQHWKETVEEIVEHARYVVVVLGKLTPGLHWEMELLLKRTDPKKLILVMPPIDETTARERWRSYCELAPLRMPEYVSGLLGVRWISRSTCEMIRTDGKGWFGDTPGVREFDAYENKLLMLKGG